MSTAATPRRRRRRRAVFVVATLLLVAGLLFVKLPQLAELAISRGLEPVFGRRVSVAEVRFSLFPPAAEVLGLRVEGRSPGGPPFLEVPRLLATPSLSSLFGPRLVLSRLRLERPRILIHAYPEKGDDIPSFKSGPAAGSELRVQRLIIEGGEFVLDHDRVPLDLDLPDFNGRLLRQSGGVLAGEVHFGPGTLRFGSAPPLEVATDVQLEIDQGKLTARGGHLRATHTDLAYSGSVTLGAPLRANFSLHGPVDLEVIDRHVMRTVFGVRGAARYAGSLTVEGSRLRLDGRFEGKDGEFDGVAIQSYAGTVAWNEAGVQLRGMDLEALGGTARLDLVIPPLGGTARLEGPLHAVDLERLAQAVFSVGTPGLGGAVSGPLRIGWPRGHFRDLSGSLALDVEQRPDGRTPVEGRLEWHAEQGRQYLDKTDLKTPTTHVSLQGGIARDYAADLSVALESSDLGASDALLLRLRRALGAREPELAGIAGAGRFEGRWAGTLRDPVFSGRFTGQEIGYLGVRWGQAEWAGSLDPGELQLHSLVLRRGASELWLDGRVQTGAYAAADELDIRTRFHEWPAEDFVKALGLGVDCAGPLSGEARVGGRRSVPTGSVRLAGTEGRCYGIPWRGLDAAAEIRGAETQIARATASVGGGHVSLRGTSRSPGVYDGSLEATDVEVGELLPAAAPGVAWGGRISASLTLQGTLDRPRLSGRIGSPRLFFGDEGIGSLDAHLEGDGSGSVAIQASCRSPRVDLRAAGRVAASPPFVADLKLETHETSLDPFIRALEPRLPASVGIVMTAEAHLEGPLARAREMKAQAQASELQVVFPEYPVRNSAPLGLDLDAGRLTVREFRLAGEGTDVRVVGDLGLAPEDSLHVQVQGAADLRAVAALTRQLRGTGSARLSVDVSGTRSAPHVDGSLGLDGAGVRVHGFPHGIEGMHGTLRFTESAAVLEGVTGTLAGGGVELRGQAAYARGRLGSFEIQSLGRGITLRYPEGLRSQVDTDLRLFGDGASQWLTGNVDVRQAVWTKRYDLASELLAESTRFERAASLEEGVHLDIKVHAPGTLRVDNNLATLQARAELSLQGTTVAPAVLGHAEIERGRVYFQGNTYTIRRGSVDFSNPERIDPHFDIEAETRARSYRVTLKVDGTLERVYPTLTSDPPLNAVQILSLLAGADETAVTNLTQAQSEQGRLAATGAASLAAGRLSEEFGLERGAERLLGLNRFSIDPSIVNGTSPTARLTVGKRLSPDLSVVYSVDLRGTGERLLSVEYSLSDRFSVLLTQSELEGYGFDLRLRQSH